jgi:hypothetical protein
VSASNVTDASESHPKKHEEQITSTDEWMRIDVKPLQENARPSNRDTFVSTSNVTDASDSHPEKQDSQITSTEEGM